MTKLEIIKFGLCIASSPVYLLLLGLELIQFETSHASFFGTFSFTSLLFLIQKINLK